MTLVEAIWLATALHTLDFPEWKLFPSEVARQRALQDIGAGKLPGWVGVALRPPMICVTMPVLLCPAAAVFQWCLGSGLGFGWALGLLLLVYGLTWGVLLWFAHRPAVRVFLRARLQTLGVLVCKECGYRLTALEPHATGDVVCPECGRANPPMDAAPAKAAGEG